MKISTAVALCIATLAMPLSAADTSTKVLFARGSSSATIRGGVRGFDTITYLVGARAGQTMTVTFKPANGSAYFSVTAPGADAAVFMGDVGGNRFSTMLPSSGDYRVQTYLMRNAARRGESAGYTITFTVR